MQAALLEHVRAHEQVRVPVATWVRPVGADPADLGGEVEDELRLRVLEEARRVGGRRQVVVAAAGRDDLVLVRLQALDQVRAEKPAAAGDESLHDATSGL